MTRLEENGVIIEEATKRAEVKPTRTFEKIGFQLGLIAVMLVDISKSLAIIADKAGEG